METPFIDSIPPSSPLQKFKTSIQMIFQSFPIMLSNLGAIGIVITNSYYAGHMQSLSPLAALGVSNSWYAFIGRGPMLCCNMGFFALASQVHGTGVIQDLKAVYQKGVMFNLFLFIISSVLLLSSPWILPLLGVQSHLIEISRGYLFLMVPCLFVDIFVDMFTNLLCVQKHLKILPVLTFLSVSINFIQAHFLLAIEESLTILAISKLLTNLYVLAFIGVYMRWKRINHFIVERFEWRSLRSLWQYAGNVVPAGIMGYVNWMAFEIMIVMASQFDERVLSAHTVFMYAISIYYCFFSGVGMLYATLLGNALGKKDFVESQRLKDLFNVLIATVLMVAFFFVGATFEWLVSLITDKEDVRKLLSEVAFLAYTFELFNFYQGNVSPAIRVIGQQEYGAKLYLICYYLVGIPIEFIFGVLLEWTLLGWFGGMCFAQLIYCFFTHKKLIYQKISVLIGDVEKGIEMSVKS